MLTESRHTVASQTPRAPVYGRRGWRDVHPNVLGCRWREGTYLRAGEAPAALALYFRLQYAGISFFVSTRISRMVCRDSAESGWKTSLVSVPLRMSQRRS